MSEKKKILYIKAQGAGDMISGIPFLVEMKKEGHEVRQIFYDMRTFMYLYDLRKLFSPTYRKALKNFKKTPSAQGWFFILELFRENGLIKDIVYIPFGLWKTIKTAIRFWKYFDEVIVPIKTSPAMRIGRFMGKKVRSIFSNTNETTSHRIVSDGELGHPALPLFSYKDNVILPSEPITLPKTYIVLFPSIFERSLLMDRWIEIIRYIKDQKISIIVLGTSREQRFMDELQQYITGYDIIDLIDKTSFPQMVYVLSNSQANILCNGGVMRVGNLVNKHNINIHTVSAFLMEPPVDNIYSYNIRPYTYPKCLPCEAAESTAGIQGIPRCVFAGTEEEGACRKAIISIHVLSILKKLLTTNLISSHG